MVIYSIKDLENLSGVKAHTLRIWEKRYNLVNPKRTKTNIRYYTDDDLRKILNVCFLYKKGYKISKIANMGQDILKEKVASYSNLDLTFEDQLDALLLFIMELDAYNFNKILDQHISQKGLEETMDYLIYPLMDKLNIAWLSGSFLGVHESFVTQTIKSKIINCIETIEDLKSPQAKFMIYLPPSESQELSLLYFHYLLKQNKSEVINLGSEVGITDVLFACKTCKPKYIFTIVNEELPAMSLQQYVNNLAESAGEATVLLTGFQTLAPGIEWPSNVILFKDLETSVNFIKSIAA